MTQIIRLAEAVTITPRTDIEVVRLVEAVKAHGPQIVRTVEELEALDPDTLVISRKGYMALAEDNVRIPVVVLATGEQVRAARKALEGA